jgi:uncharacterized damage-inducible protein DinB
MSLSENIVADFEAESKRTRAVLEAVPQEHLDWKPHEKSMTLGQLAGHLAENPSWVQGFLEDEMDFAQLEGYQPFVPTTTAELMGALEANTPTVAEALAGREDAFMDGTWTMRMGDQVFKQEPRHTAMREILVHHAVHHRGQLTVYLRLLGVPVPVTYGSTADHPMA